MSTQPNQQQQAATKDKGNTVLIIIIVLILLYFIGTGFYYRNPFEGFILLGYLLQGIFGLFGSLFTSSSIKY
jgi:hypothetical protein